MVIGADVARQCIQEGLIDEIVVYLAPVLLGDGVRFFKVADVPEATTATGDESRRFSDDRPMYSRATARGSSWLDS